MPENRTWVFAGPSLPPALRPVTEAFVWRPPAVAGDGLAAIEASPHAVVLIDGLFGGHPAIRHKELLALMDHGVPVIGGSSMGALRAAELRTCGMIGVGRIFEAYARGRLVGDDEVALLHGPAGMDWAPLTLPLVNVRATLQRAVRERVVQADTARLLRKCAAAIFFQDRTWRVLLETAAAGDAPVNELERFAAWAPHAYVDLKQIDALQCIAMATSVARPVHRRSPAPRPTVFTDALMKQIALGRRPDLAS
jgi:hypothetical protein